MHYVYILKSINHPEKSYVGYTASIEQRLNEHNQGKSVYTSKYKPWILHAHIVLPDREKALAFEKFLKTGSGKVFIKKYLL